MIRDADPDWADGDKRAAAIAGLYLRDDRGLLWSLVASTPPRPNGDEA